MIGHPVKSSFVTPQHGTVGMEDVSHAQELSEEQPPKDMYIFLFLYHHYINRFLNRTSGNFLTVELMKQEQRKVLPTGLCDGKPTVSRKMDVCAPIGTIEE